jgi:glyoxylase-like metal-dependent hydrolase (beta-lactamase superfamily II)
VVFDHTGEVAPGFYVAGISEIPTYFLDGPRPVLFDAGISAYGPRYVQDLEKLLGPRSPAILFLTHVHFDHCGAAAHLQARYPGLVIAASARAAEIIRRPGALKLITELNASAAETVRQWHPEMEPGEGFRPFTVDRVLADGDRLELAPDLHLEVLATPGHTWDFLSYYIPEKKILIASEAAGCADTTGYVVTEFLVDFEVYLKSLKRLAALEAEVLCQGHRLVYTGPDVRSYFDRSIRAALEFRAGVMGKLREEKGDVIRVIQRVKAEEYDPRPHPKQPEPAYLINIEARVRHLARGMDL